jgi:hypothetical protein
VDGVKFFILPKWDELFKSQVRPHVVLWTRWTRNLHLNPNHR